MSELPKVLLLDDERSVLGVLREVLRKQFDVVIAMEGEDALRKLRAEGPFQVVLSDMQMSGMNGIEFLRRANEIDPWSVKMLLTGHGDLRTAMSAVNEGQIFRFLTKPCPPKQLVKAFEEASEHFERRDQQRRNVIGDKARISRRMVKTQGYALLGRFVDAMASELTELTKRHSAALDQALATAESGGFVTVDELNDLRAVEHALEQIVGRVLTFVSPAQKPEEVQLSDVVDRALERVRWLGSDRVAVEKEVGATVPAVNVAPDLLEQALTNLLENAFEALAGHDGAKIVVRVYYDMDSDHVVCEVSDNGPGVHREVAPFVMRPFFTTSGLERAGLGLPVAQSVIESFAGTLAFESTPGAGATFSVRLPAIEMEADTLSDR